MEAIPVGTMLAILQNIPDKVKVLMLFVPECIGDDGGRNCAQSVLYIW